MTVAVAIPLRTYSMSNMRVHWARRSRIVRSERDAVRLLCAREIKPSMVPCTVKLTRFGPRPLDDDNVRGALKAIRDEVAALLGVDDRDPRVRWDYVQRHGRYAVVVEVEW